MWMYIGHFYVNFMISQQKAWKQFICTKVEVVFVRAINEYGE
jgi:hypothetical protein